MSISFLTKFSDSLNSTFRFFPYRLKSVFSKTELNLFFSRVGLKFGYTGSFLYDTQKTSLPNMFAIESFRKTFTESIYADYISFSLDLDFVPIIGRLTETMFNTHFDFHIYLHQQLFKFQFSIEFGY